MDGSICSRRHERIVLGVTVQALQQLTGANYSFYHVSHSNSLFSLLSSANLLYQGAVNFNGAGISNVNVTQMILGGVNFSTTFGGLYAIEHFDRRKSRIAGGI